MRYLLDTNACIRIINGSSEAVIHRFRSKSPAAVSVCSVVKAELYYGARKSRWVAKKLHNLEQFFAPFRSYEFNDAAAEHYGLMRADLAHAGTPIGANDLLIASIARANELTLVTHNTDEFSRLVGLRVEDWETGIGR